MEFNSEFEVYAFGDNQYRRRLARVTASGLRVGPGVATPRATGADVPKPLSQYDWSGEQEGYRLEHTERGHIVGLQFGGPERRDNLVPMYAGFNGGSGAWGQMETALATLLWANQHRRVWMDTRIHYPAIDTAIPHLFVIECRAEGSVGVPFDVFPAVQVHVQAPPQLSYDHVDEADLKMLDVLKRAQREMMERGWLIENTNHIQVLGSGRPSRNRGPVVIPLSVGELDATRFDLAQLRDRLAYYHSRPYAVLDYLWFEQRATFRELGLADPGEMNNSKGFSEGQRSAVRKLNVLSHVGYMKSDIHGLVEGLEDYDNLYVGSADASAQVDHIWPEGESGSNCFSNARLASKMANIRLNNHDQKARIQAYFENPANRGALAQRLIDFWTGL